MPKPPAPTAAPALRFRRIAFAAAAFAVLCFACTLWMLLHFNAGVASVRFGPQTMLNIASVALPGPVLLFFLAWQARYGFCRVLGWVALLPTLFVGGMFAFFATTQLRPPISPASYDAAVRESEANMLVAAMGANPFLELLKEIRTEFHQHPTTQSAYASLLERTRVVREQLEAHAKKYPSIRAAMQAPFDDRAISPARRDEYLRMIFQRLDPDKATEADQKIIQSVRTFEARLKLLADNWGKWRWLDETRPRFDDEALSNAYDALIDATPTP